MTNNPPTHDDAESEAERVETKRLGVPCPACGGSGGLGGGTAIPGKPIQTWKHDCGRCKGKGTLAVILESDALTALSHERQLREEAERECRQWRNQALGWKEEFDAAETRVKELLDAGDALADETDHSDPVKREVLSEWYVARDGTTIEQARSLLDSTPS